MKNSEILIRYKHEVNSAKYEKIHDNYRKDYAQLINKYQITNKGTKPLAVISVLLFIICIYCVVIDNPIACWIFCGILALVLIIWKVNNCIYKNKENKIYSKSSALHHDITNLNAKYLSEYNSVIGYFRELDENSCCDYDSYTENYYCSVNGRQLSYPEYLHCKNAHAFEKCKYSKEYYNNLYKD